MTIMLGTLCLNEMEWLPRLYQQHKDWPGMVQWVFVESADRVYAETNPEMVRDGLSVDGTTEYLEQLAKDDDRIIHVRHGLSRHADPAQGKCESRNRYLEAADPRCPDFLFVLDADEFYTLDGQRRIVQLIGDAPKRETGFIFKQRHIWHPPSAEDEPLLRHEVVGAYWNVPHCRAWRWIPGMRYRDNHNTPEADGRSLGNAFHRYDHELGSPVCVHMGFASSLRSRQAKHRYYVARGEGTKDKRQSFVDCRRAFETLTPQRAMPHGARIIHYEGPIPECFL